MNFELANYSTRRRFIKTSVLAGAALGVGPRLVFGQPAANETLNLAAVGVGGQGASDLGLSAAGKNVRVVALCDVDRVNLAAASERHNQAPTFKDYRVMLDQMGKDIDAMLISTPDHMHGPIALAAMQLGIHVHVQKPLAHNLAELRAMQTMAADNPKLVTQMGTQIHSHSAYRTAVQTFRSGVIGKVKEAHLWVSRSLAGPADGRPAHTDAVPDRLDWDLWLGVAPKRPYVNGLYHPFHWRGWKDFGSGTLGDIGCHIFDPVFSCLDLGMPTHVVSKGPEHGNETFAPDGDFHYQFKPTKYTTDDFSFRWIDGRKPDASLAQMPEGKELPEAGMFLVGEHGVMVLPHVADPLFYSEGKPLDVKREVLPSLNHYTQFTDACQGIGETSTPFSYAAAVTEAVLVGTVAGRFKDRKLRWNSEKLTFDHAPATQVVNRTYREGWDALEAHSS